MVSFGWLFAITLLAYTNLVAGVERRPAIFTKADSIHIRSGDNGNIVFEHSQQGKVIVNGNELNVSSVGPKGDRGEKGNDGVNGSRGTTGDTGAPGLKGDRGQTGLQGHNGTGGPLGQKGDSGVQGPPGSPGNDGTVGLNGLKGSQGHPGSPGVNGTQGGPGPPGPKGDVGETSYYIEDSQKIQCNSSNYGVFRYFSTRLQLCTPKGWRYLAFHDSEPTRCPIDNVPATNLKAFYAASPGIMFQFNNNFSPLVNPPNLFNITPGILPWNSTLSYEDAVMRQAGYFSGNAYLNVSGIPDDFWTSRNWSVMALMKYRAVPPRKYCQVLGHGIESNNQGLHLGLSDKKVIHGYYSNDFIYGTKLVADKWYHLTWTSEKSAQGKEKRCIYINGDTHECKPNNVQYRGSGDTTVGTWWHRTNQTNLVLDHLIIASGIVQYKATNDDDKQLCNAQKVEEYLP